MLLAMDVGNTNITIGVFQGDDLKITWRLGTDTQRTMDEYSVTLLGLLEREGMSRSQIKDIAICSVVPPLTGIFEDVSHRYFNIRPLTVTTGVKTGVRILYDDPRAVGPDRVADAAAAYKLYGGPVIIVDFGTATVFDAVTKDGDYLGGAIAPGLGISTEALYQRTALLPRIQLVRPPQAIGRNTVTSMQSGIIFGTVGMVEGMVKRFKEELGGEAVVVATGGLAELIAKEAPLIQHINLELTLLGLLIIYQLNR